MSLNFCIFCGGNPATPVMSCKAKKNKQEEFHLAFICCQIRHAFCLKCNYITAEMPIEGGFSHNTHGRCHHSCPQTRFTPLTWDHLAFSFAHSWIFPSSIKGKAMFAQWFILHQGQAAWAANQVPLCCRTAAKMGGSPHTGRGGTWHRPGVIPLGCGVLPRGLVYVGPHHAHISDLTAHTVSSPCRTQAERWCFDFLESLLTYTTTTADLEIPIGVALLHAFGSTWLFRWWQGAGFGPVLWCHYFGNDFWLTDIFPLSAGCSHRTKIYAEVH